MGFWDQVENTASVGLASAGAGDDAESAYIQQLQQIVNGQGANPALAMLRNQSNANSQMEAGQIASTRGMSPALQARQILENNAANQQRTAGQAAELQAQQSLGALGGVGSAISNQRTQNQQTAFPVLQGVTSAAGSGLAAGAMGSGNDNSSENGTTPLASDTEGIMEYGGGEIPQKMAGGGIAQNGVSQFIPALAEMLLRNGGAVPGRAEVAGNSPRNDTVPARLSPGEIVIPRSISTKDDAPARAAAFVEAIKKKHGMEPTEYGKVVAARRRAKEAA